MTGEFFTDKGLNLAEGALEVTHISCDNCGLLDIASAFPSFNAENPAETERFKATLLGFGIDYDGNPLHQSAVQTEYAGACCPGCGNYSSLDFDPFGTLFAATPPELLD